jgi:hypothetical protein
VKIKHSAEKIQVTHCWAVPAAVLPRNGSGLVLIARVLKAGDDDSGLTRVPESFGSGNLGHVILSIPSASLATISDSFVLSGNLMRRWNGPYRSSRTTGAVVLDDDCGMSTECEEDSSIGLEVESVYDGCLTP